MPNSFKTFSIINFKLSNLKFPTDRNSSEVTDFIKLKIQVTRIMFKKIYLYNLTYLMPSWFDSCNYIFIQDSTSSFVLLKVEYEFILNNSTWFNSH